ncbi:MAG TPA: AbrB/MazE/SpoVT family DNA-binding domain-containing protein [Anaerolineales bacterium]|nr:AbrB/MazE/SpoVT family DNA-binding domain-containing protein [Anaerolineales bacterium]
MTTTVSITSQWQIYLPEQIRKALGLSKPTQATLTVHGDKLIVTPKTSPFLTMAGKYIHKKPTQPINLNRVRDLVDYTKI